MMRTARQTATRLAGGFLAAAMACGLAACSDTKEEAAPEESTLDYPGYLVSTPLLTSNAGSNLGASTNAQVLSGRVYPGVYTPGPSGQMIPNTDLATAQVLPGENRQVVYTIAEDAKFSDGVEITCTDFFLTYKAGEMSELFGSYLPLMRQVQSLECTPGAKTFTVVFEQKMGGRWRNLFGPGEVLPAHSIARKADMSQQQLTSALVNDDRAALVDLAGVWREGYDLGAFDPELQVSAGPYLIEKVGERGEVVLARNESYYGDPASLERLTVWPGTSDVQELRDQTTLRVADVSNGASHEIGGTAQGIEADPYDVYSEAGALTDTLVLGSDGIFATKEARGQFAACVDQAAVAQASSHASGVEVPPTAAHVVGATDPVRHQLADIADPHLGVDVGIAEALRGSTVRIGYMGPDQRKADMVEAIRLSCEPAGITVVDASAEGGDMGTLVGTAAPGTETMDAVLRAVDPAAEYGEMELENTETPALRNAESQLWDEVTAIPLAAQPRTFVVDPTVSNVNVYTGLTGIGWNLDRWQMSKD
ncbi:MULTISPECIES: ABC transporter substrate-binding protein [unclassified Corynebacterium]|uniref:ABC transporter substrate-binding protein n=1 Tax=unclassified Corynebacterium TaxID=2624378 RepID=UPI0029CA9FFF|nr:MULTISPECIES: ABC transporter substrate-binding protein [unclassified Corynebacterium]WPF65197.1 ABC transporter substrate-binding protein [Corynebacterium sp. 22KM0430]WPF67692.1 ABC transporter substrate-binding protein [Corynebacterium sp. 21KM1197]